MEPNNTAAKKIEEAEKNQSTVLDLSKWVLDEQELDEIPEQVFKLHHLEQLKLYGNNITIIPERIREMPNLKHLNVALNPIKKIADIPGLTIDWNTFIKCEKQISLKNIRGIHIFTQDKISAPSRILQELTKMKSLRLLHIGRSIISATTKIPKPTAPIANLITHIGNLEQIEDFSIFAVQLEDFPAGIFKLLNLRRLVLCCTDISTVPERLSELKQLSIIGFWGNNLSTLPLSLASLPKLQNLEISENKFNEIPEVIYSIKSLKNVNLANDTWRGNPGLIRHIPAKIQNLTNLIKLNISGQPIETPPPEVVKEGISAIQNYWRQQQEFGVDYLCEAKLIIVGEPGAGKTSLANKIKDSNYVLHSEEKSTEGIEVIHCSFPSGIRIKENGCESLLKRDFNVNIWDFGGQEVYHSTHQFFLTRRSLYALVVDARKEDTDFDYWLHIVEILSDGSPLLVVQNEKQDRKRNLDIGSLRARFPSLCDTFCINLATNRGLGDLVKAIHKKLEGLPHIGTPLPKTWSLVRAALEKDLRNYISLEEYLSVCENNGFSRREDKLQLSGYLHDLGICLHFQDDPVLKNTVILKPKWGTDAVYRVLDDITVLSNSGRFSKDDLARIWAEKSYASMHHELLRLMMKFQLCYALPDCEEYIAPQLLCHTRPIYDWNSSNNLIIRYEYDFMPKGIVTRFIVALNHLIAEPTLVWKSGVIIERMNTQGEVSEDYQRRKITVRATGPDSRGLIAIVDDQLERIHRSFPFLKYEKFLPCSCETCRRSNEPFSYPLTELIDFARGGDKIQCRVSRKLVEATALIRNVLPSAVYVNEVGADHPDVMRKVEYIDRNCEPGKEVFVSYSWASESNSIVDKLEKAFKGREVLLIRDKNNLQYKDSIRKFMKRIGSGKCIVVVLSKAYLESKNCMFELTEIAGNKEILKRVFPVILPDANIYDAIGRLHYISFWEKKKQELDSMMKTVGGENLQGIREDLDLYDKIRGTIASIVDILCDMNSLTSELHQTSNFAEIEKALKAQLSD